MPISPDKMRFYPGGSIRSKEWLAIRERIRNRAGDGCEQCGVPNGEWVIRHPDETWEVSNSEAAVKIVCTVAHLDNDLVDHSDENLRFWCQRCHNRHDAPHRARNARETRNRKSGQGELL
jgi:hypothetical protein